MLSTESLFYVCIIPFIIFFGSFAFILYPLRDVLHPTGAPPCHLPSLKPTRPKTAVLCTPQPQTACSSDAAAFRMQWYHQ